jgi:hypothetical protein
VGPPAPPDGVPNPRARAIPSNGVLEVGPLDVPRIDDNPAAADRGNLTVHIHGHEASEGR